MEVGSHWDQEMINPLSEQSPPNLDDGSQGKAAGPL